MDRWTWVVIRAYWPAVVMLVIAVVSAALLSSLPTSPLLAGVAVLGRWVPLLALAATVGLWLGPTYRLVQWERGKGPECPRCLGPLGHERAGYASRGGAYRQCYMCGDNVNHRHYE